ncbi:hypothetical protein DPMN_154238 [Dreissena polymorpha]|uniref:Uncharacterized protein n=1 Tax=Dreissena polymorpha TaxID=45954 RepID=A0A9D4FKL8_DREPO|nr:hypothetical protein DPMN_154238 [Dreissena polymorpha]
MVANAAPIENFFPPELVDCVNRLSPLANTTHRTASLSVDLKQMEDASQSTAEQEAIDYAGTDMPTLGTPEDVHLHCIRQLVWKKDMVRWEDYNITKTDIDFVNSLLASVRLY